MLSAKESKGEPCLPGSKILQKVLSGFRVLGFIGSRNIYATGSSFLLLVAAQGMVR